MRFNISQRLNPELSCVSCWDAQFLRMGLEWRCTIESARMIDTNHWYVSCSNEPMLGRFPQVQGSLEQLLYLVIFPFTVVSSTNWQRSHQTTSASPLELSCLNRRTDIEFKAMRCGTQTRANWRKNLIKHNPDDNAPFHAVAAPHNIFVPPVGTQRN